MLIHVLTAVTRPDNLPQIEDSIKVADERDELHVVWHKYPDLERKYVGGQRPKNQMLAFIEDGWVCILDDDTVMHPSFLRRVYRAHRQNPYADAIVVSQRRTTGVVLQACPENMEVGKVDAGQVLIKRSLIGDLRIPETYAGDGEWIEALLRYEPSVVFLPQVLSLHNALSGVDVSEPPERMQA